MYLCAEIFVGLRGLFTVAVVNVHLVFNHVETVVLLCHFDFLLNG
jgi:hypothetical protein